VGGGVLGWTGAWARWAALAGLPLDHRRRGPAPQLLADDGISGPSEDVVLGQLDRDRVPAVRGVDRAAMVGQGKLAEGGGRFVERSDQATVGIFDSA
jgi:hypothetical protein